MCSHGVPRLVTEMNNIRIVVSDHDFCVFVNNVNDANDEAVAIANPKLRNEVFSLRVRCGINHLVDC